MAQTWKPNKAMSVKMLLSALNNTEERCGILREKRIYISGQLFSLMLWFVIPPLFKVIKGFY